ncbi:M50 family metallopeptidase [Candidatus Saccharibacteria bacterium]|nr:M50 family metallopeptidase [Candidatus Saccharibacteria bacterium]
MTIIGIIIGLIILTLIVIIHELGHALAAIKNGVVVEEFGIGFPPRAWGKKLKNGVLLSLNWLPIGGFCKMQGEHDSDNKKGDYGRASLWGKTQILFGGVIFNLILAVVIFTILAVVGLPKLFDNQFSIPSDTKTILSPVTIGHIENNTPAAKAGLKVGDQLVSIAGQSLNRGADVSKVTAKHKGQNIIINYKRNGKLVSVRTTLRAKNNDSKGYLGIGVDQSENIKATWSAPIVGVATTVQLTTETFKGVGGLIGNFFGGLAKQLSFNRETRQEGQKEVNQAGEGVSGPIGIVGILFPQAARMGPITLLMLAGIISLSLAVMNTLPIPALDGGRWLVTMIFRLRRKKLTPDLEEKINTIGFMVLMAFVVLITVVDVFRLF